MGDEDENETRFLCMHYLTSILYHNTMLFSTLPIYKHQRVHVNPGSGRSKCHAVMSQSKSQLCSLVALCMAFWFLRTPLILAKLRLFSLFPIFCRRCLFSKKPLSSVCVYVLHCDSLKIGNKSDSKKQEKEAVSCSFTF